MTSVVMYSPAAMAGDGIPAHSSWDHRYATQPALIETPRSAQVGEMPAALPVRRNLITCGTS